MKKAEAKFYRNKKNEIDFRAKSNVQFGWWDVSNPVFIPKRKKFKK